MTVSHEGQMVAKQGAVPSSAANRADPTRRHPTRSPSRRQSFPGRTARDTGGEHQTGLTGFSGLSCVSCLPVAAATQTGYPVQISVSFLPRLPPVSEGMRKKLKIPCQSGRRVLISAQWTTRFSKNNWRCEGQGRELRKEQTGWARGGDPCGSGLPFGLPVPRRRPTKKR